MTPWDELNFLLTNRIPRRLLTLWMGRLSKVRHPLVRVPAIGLWRMFCDVDLTDAEQPHFASLHDAFTRALRPGARPVDPDPAVLVSPCDGFVVASGVVTDGLLLQAKGLTYTLTQLLLDPQRAALHEGCAYVTLRLTAGMYHRFHAPTDCHVGLVRYISGDTWNVNPPALRRIAQLYCRNERAVIEAKGPGGDLTLVPVAAVLVASIRLRFANVLLHLRYRGANPIACSARLAKGEEMGWFEHGSTIIVLLPAGSTLTDRTATGSRLRMGEPLARLPYSAA